MSTKVLQVSKQKSRKIVVGEENYKKLVEMGRFQETFDDVISRILASQKDRGDF